MQGYAVRLSNFITNVCLAILIARSDKNIEESVSVVLLQTYTLLGCTFISIARRTLSVADAHFALTSTISPLALYLIYASCRHFFKRRSNLFQRLGESSMIYGILSLLLVVLWVVLDFLIYFANAFPPTNHPCPDITLVGWIFYRIVAIMITLNFTLFIIPLLPLFWIIYALRHFKDIRNEYRRHKGKVRPRKGSWPRRVLRSIKYFFLSQWNVITMSHAWLTFIAIVIFYVSWASALLIWVVDIGYFYWEVANAAGLDVGKYQPPDGYDPLGFGQLLAAAVAVQPLWEVFKLIWKRRWDLWVWIQGYPQSLWNGIVFIVTGHRNPWSRVIVSKLEEGHSYNSVPLNSEIGDEVPMSQPQHKVTSASPEKVVIPQQLTLYGAPSNPDLSQTKSLLSLSYHTGQDGTTRLYSRTSIDGT